jgi:hypothetical protein
MVIGSGTCEVARWSTSGIFKAMERILFEVVANIRLSSKNVSHMGFLDAQRALLGDQFPHG